MESLACLNGTFLALEEAKISVLDRGFLFGDGVYEVVRVYCGKPFHLESHLRRLKNSLSELQIDYPLDSLPSKIDQLLSRSGIQEATLYFQITRGVAAKRSHAFPRPAIAPTELLYISHFSDPYASLRQTGARAVSFPDLRWGRCDIKSVNLLGNVIAAENAAARGAQEAILVNSHGAVTEGTHTSLFTVRKGALCVPPLQENILPGLTRELVLEFAKQLSIPVSLGSTQLSDLWIAEEVFVTGTTSEVMPLIEIDNRPLAATSPGPITRQLQQAYRNEVSRLCGKA